MTMKQELLVLEILDVGGVPTPNLKVVLRAMDICQRQGLGQHFAGTKKIVYVKPLQLVRMLLPAYPHILLVDNDLEKSKGVGPASRRRWANAPQEHMEVPAFRGEMVDNCLHSNGGASWMGLLHRLDQLRSPAVGGGQQRVSVLQLWLVQHQ